MTSAIDPTKPTAGQATTESVRDNFQAAKDEIEALQPGGGDAFNAYLDGLSNIGTTGQPPDLDVDLALVNSRYTVTAGTQTNLPPMVAGQPGILSTYIFGGPANAIQRVDERNATGVDTVIVWQRLRKGAVWGAWSKIVDGGAFTLRLAGMSDLGRHDSSIDDLNTILTNSIYTTSTSAVNAPADFVLANRGYLHTMMNSAANGTQILYGRLVDNQYKIWMRSYNSAWGAWKLVVDGNLFSLPLPTSDPLVSGALWNNAGVVNVSA